MVSKWVKPKVGVILQAQPSRAPALGKGLDIRQRAAKYLVFCVTGMQRDSWHCFGVSIVTHGNISTNHVHVSNYKLRSINLSSVSKMLNFAIWRNIFVQKTARDSR